MSLFSDALSVGFGAVEDAAGELITYTHADGTIQRNVLAVPGQHETEEASPAGRVLVTSRSADWLIRKHRLTKQPKRGDLITCPDGREYQATPAGGGGVWEWSDTSETHYRIHTAKNKG